jgi:hypothetical protein
MATMGPSAWQVGVMAALEVGVSAAIAAWVTNWALLRRLVPKPVASAEEIPAVALPPAAAGSEGKTGSKGKNMSEAKAGGRVRSRLRGRAKAKAEVETGGQTGSPAKEPKAAGQPVRAASSLQFVDPEPVLAPRRPARPVSEVPAPRVQPDDQGATIHVLRPGQPDGDR